eukprot:TRINITY_DN52653_c0_g1_i1.p1 TRINITY_DN52653_c0_g1~~TRINITY_DN52653_c0_g1_i1.p1  ORF type:complete len:283 (+),score=55.04 TRINITY_DN52653_c0_g1_i1:67-915(+)
MVEAGECAEGTNLAVATGISTCAEPATAVTETDERKPATRPCADCVCVCIDPDEVIEGQRVEEAVLLRSLTGFYMWTGGFSFGRRVYAKANSGGIDGFLASIYYWPWQDKITGELREGWLIGAGPGRRIWSRCCLNDQAPAIAETVAAARERNNTAISNGRRYSRDFSNGSNSGGRRGSRGSISVISLDGATEEPPSHGWDLPLVVSSCSAQEPEDDKHPPNCCRRGGRVNALSNLCRVLTCRRPLQDQMQNREHQERRRPLVRADGGITGGGSGACQEGDD